MNTDLSIADLQEQDFFKERSLEWVLDAIIPQSFQLSLPILDTVLLHSKKWFLFDSQLNRVVKLTDSESLNVKTVIKKFD